MVARVIKTKSDFAEQNEKCYAWWESQNAHFPESKVHHFEAKTLFEKIVDGKSILYKVTAIEIKENYFEAKNATKIDTFVSAGFTVYAVSEKNYYAVMKLYEEMYT